MEKNKLEIGEVYSCTYCGRDLYKTGNVVLFGNKFLEGDILNMDNSIVKNGTEFKCKRCKNGAVHIEHPLYWELPKGKTC